MREALNVTLRPLIESITDATVLAAMHKLIIDARQYQYNETQGHSPMYAAWAHCEDSVIKRGKEIGVY